METTDFGFEQVTPEAKTQKVKSVFDSVASRYDVMNDLMSVGMHRLWKRQAVAMLGLRQGMRVLDCAGGTGDLSRLIFPKIGTSGQLILADINETMVTVGRERMLDQGIIPIHYCIGDAAELPIAAGCLDRVIIGFGLRNVTDKARALAEFARVLKPGGQLLILEFSKPMLPVLTQCYDAFSFKVIPKIGEMVTGDRESYQYLVESIRRHPDQQALAELIKTAGFDDCKIRNLCGGIVAIHQAYVY